MRAARGHESVRGKGAGRKKREEGRKEKGKRKGEKKRRKGKKGKRRKRKGGAGGVHGVGREPSVASMRSDVHEERGEQGKFKR